MAELDMDVNPVEYLLSKYAVRERDTAVRLTVLGRKGAAGHREDQGGVGFRGLLSRT